MSPKFNIRLFAYKDADPKIFEVAKDRFLSIIPSDHLAFDTGEPDLLYFVSGGSEAEAVQYVQKNKFVILAAFAEDNAYAAATEVKAYADQTGCDCVLLPLDDSNSIETLILIYRIYSGLDNLKHKRLGLIGKVSNWLVASNVSDNVLKDKFGIRLIRIPWEDIDDHTNFLPTEEFVSKYQQDNSLNVSDASRIHSLVKNVIKAYKLDAITVECFSLVKNDHVTACLALSDLNDAKIPAGCEGDLSSITGMMIVHEITGIIPWMANLAKIDGNKVIFAHCTAPTALLNGFDITTHFETGMGTAIKGEFRENLITIIRFDNELEQLFATTGQIVEKPNLKGYCRTQILVEMDHRSVHLLKNKPLGNHHLIIPGNHLMTFELMTRIKNIKYIISNI